MLAYLLAGLMRLVAANDYDDGSGMMLLAVVEKPPAIEMRVRVTWCSPLGMCTWLEGPDGPEYAGGDITITRIPESYAGEISPFTSMGLTE